MEFREGDSLEGSAHSPMYNPHILPLRSLEFLLSQNVNSFMFTESISDKTFQSLIMAYRSPMRHASPSGECDDTFWSPNRLR